MKSFLKIILLIIFFALNACSTDKDEKSKNIPAETPDKPTVSHPSPPVPTDDVDNSTPPGNPVEQYQNTEIEKELIRLVNLHRVNNVKVGSLTAVAGISELCSKHVDYMIGLDQLNHNDADKREVESRKLFKVNKTNLFEENVGYVYYEGSITATANMMLKRYLESKAGHRETIENPDHTHIGVGIKVAANGKYYNCLITIQVKP